jgi:DNA helicase-2/ATP-dependent DNA helicase PcrA
MKWVSTHRWTDEQAEVVFAKPGHRVVFAAPGSGKTAVLTAHMQQQLRTRKLRGRDILSVTFTREAAAELKARLMATKGIAHSELESVRVGTFHAQVFRALLEWRPDIPVPLRGQEQVRLVRTALELAGMAGSAVQVRRTLATLTRIKSAWPPVTAPRQVRRVLALYESLKARARRWDLDDLLVAMCHLLADPAARARVPWVWKNKYILVDEFQDTNAVQWQILRNIHEITGARLFVVGDDDQAIYGFRGASPRWLNQFPSTFAPVAETALSTNFRSDTRIVQHAGLLIAHNQQRRQKRLHAYSQAPGQCQAFMWPNELAEGQAVLTMIRACWAMRGPLSTAVLARTRRQLVAIYRALPVALCRRVGFHTFHEAKGREWDVVHVVGAVNDNPYLWRDGSDEGDGQAGRDSEEEERRLFYVAMTRARHALFIHVPAVCAGRPGEPSPYLTEAAVHVRPGAVQGPHAVRRPN